MNAREILLKTVPENCQWLDMDNLTNTPIRYVLSAMEKFSEQELAALKSENERLKEEIEKEIKIQYKLVDDIKSLQADKDELVDALKDITDYGDVVHPRLITKVYSLLSKHETK